MKKTGKSNLAPAAVVAVGLLAGGLLAGRGGTSAASASQQAAPAVESHAPSTSQGHGGAGAHWDYAGDLGPAFWATLSDEYATCASGEAQSPIDLDDTDSIGLTDVRFDYAPAQLQVTDNGHTVQANAAPGSSIVVDGTPYALAQFHFHAPSEHTVNGRAAAMEMHLVHKSAEGELAVVGVLVEEGAANPAFDPVWAVLPSAEGETAAPAAPVDLTAMLPADRSAVRYDGSLTTPPCSEGVEWHVLAEPVQMSTAQVDAFRALHDHSARPVQPRYDRAVLADVGQD